MVATKCSPYDFYDLHWCMKCECWIVASVLYVHDSVDSLGISGIVLLSTAEHPCLCNLHILRYIAGFIASHVHVHTPYREHSVSGLMLTVGTWAMTLSTSNLLIKRIWFWTFVGKKREWSTVFTCIHTTVFTCCVAVTDVGICQLSVCQHHAEMKECCVHSTSTGLVYKGRMATNYSMTIALQCNAECIDKEGVSKIRTSAET